MAEGIKTIAENVASFKKKYYLNLFIRGLTLTSSLLLCYFLIATTLEYTLWLNPFARLLIFICFWILVIVSFYFFLKSPIQWWLAKKGLGEEESAKIIGAYFPTVKDKLLNLLQLASGKQSGPLITASILQRSSSLENIRFEKAIDLNENKKYLKYFGLPLIAIASVFAFNANIFTDSTKRIVRFNEEFAPSAPFQFLVDETQLIAFFNEDFSLDLSLKGSVIPEAVYILNGTQRIKMVELVPGKFQYTFEKLQQNLDLQFEASGFYSKHYKVSLINRPDLIQLKMILLYPSYLNKNNEVRLNAGSLSIPEGTFIRWQAKTANALDAQINFSGADSWTPMQMTDAQLFEFGKEFRNPDQYSILLKNEKSKNKDKISYHVEVIKDAYPQIVVDNIKDSILYKNVFLGGLISDDYSNTQLKLNFEVVRSGSSKSEEKTISLPITPRRQQQNFFFQWNIDSLSLSPGDKINYYLQVWDNDGVNGHKSTRSSNYTFSLPGKSELQDAISKSQQSTENRMDKSLVRAKEIKKSILEAQEKLKGKQNLDWQDKKMLENLIQQQKDIEQSISELQRENDLLEQKKETFSHESDRIKEKSEQIQKLMNELLDDETKKLFEMLDKMLKENSDLSQMQKVLEKMDRKEINLEKELERTLELFKQLQYEFKLEQSLEDLKEQINRQEELLKETQEIAKETNKGKDSNQDKAEKPSSKKDEDNSKKNSSDLAKEQGDLNQKFDEFKKAIEELSELGHDLKKEDNLPNRDELEQVEKSQENSKKSLEESKPKEASDHQKNTINQMKQSQEQMESSQGSMEMELDMQNLESLKQILHGLIKLSFDQEGLMKDFNYVQQTDPKYLLLSQNQLKLKDDAKILEDSLLALSKRDPFLSSIVTKEVGDLNDHLDKSIDHIKERRKSNAGTEMQFSMTSINNLALLLNDHFNSMMDMLANATPSMRKGKNGKTPKNLSELQKQLNEQIEQMKKGKMQGREMSEQLAKMAAEQERIRKALQEMQQKMKKEGGKAPGDDIAGKMEQTEMDLVNKQITEQTIRRQKEIMTRLLETENAMREQNEDEERKGETAKEHKSEIPKAFEDYLRLKEKELELLKTVPPKLFPYYKKEVNKYFERIGNN